MKLNRSERMTLRLLKSSLKGMNLCLMSNPKLMAGLFNSEEASNFILLSIGINTSVKPKKKTKRNL
jgi:hypothetical protein